MSEFQKILQNLARTSAGFRQALAEEHDLGGFPQGELPLEESAEYNLTLDEVVERLEGFITDWTETNHQYYKDVELLLDEIQGGEAEIPMDIESLEMPGMPGGAEYGSNKGCGCGRKKLNNIKAKLSRYTQADEFSDCPSACCQENLTGSVPNGPCEMLSKSDCNAMQGPEGQRWHWSASKTCRDEAGNPTQSGKCDGSVEDNYICCKLPNGTCKVIGGTLTHNTCTCNALGGQVTAWDPELGCPACNDTLNEGPSKTVFKPKF
jgi:hypothetical protein